MRILIALILSMPAWAQFGAATQVVNGNGTPNVAYCASANNVGMVYARKDGEAAASTFYVCSNTGVGTYAWELLGGAAGGGDVEGGTNLTNVGAIPYVSAAATLSEDGSFLRSAKGQYTLYDPTGGTGVSKLVVREGAGQGSTGIFETQDTAGVTSHRFSSGPAFYQFNGSSDILSNLTSGNWYVANNKIFGFSSAVNLNGGNLIDAAIGRNGIGIIEVNNGTLGTLRDLIQRHPLGGGTAPTITSGFGTTPSIAGSDSAGRVTVGTGGTAATGTITFGTAWATAPACTAANETTQLALFPTATTTTLVLASSTPFTAADKLVYICVGY